TNGGPRIHYLEFARPIDLTAGTVPAADNEGDTGDPILSFWHAYDILTNASIRVEYTRDPIDTTAPRTWTTLPDGMLVDFTPPSGAPGANEQVARTNLSMQPVSMNLALIPGVDTDPFYLRFAIYVNSSAT